MCFDIGIVVCGPNEALVVSGMFQVYETNKQKETALNLKPSSISDMKRPVMPEGEKH